MASSTECTIWRLRRGMDRRFRSGHPWVYSNELTESPKSLEPGAPVELRDASGKFLARGYGNPKSLIAFRTLSRNPDRIDPTSSSSILETLKNAGKLRQEMGFSQVSHRLSFGEADHIPGLVIDRYLFKSGQSFVVQAHTAGADRMVGSILEVLERYVQTQENSPGWSQTSVILRSDMSVRKLEGLPEGETQILRAVAGQELKEMDILVRSALGGKPLQFQVDLIGGQKTGFFLDQFSNIQVAAERFQHIQKKKLRILDLCTYVGQWGTQLSRVFKDLGSEVEVVAVDASAQALDLAQKNIQRQGARCEKLKANVLKDLGQLTEKSFDIVVSDPPALIKGRKDIPAGTHAYLQLATQVFRLVKNGGGVVCCSCSGLLEEESFTQVLAKGAQRNNVQVRWVGRGSQSPDHPMLLEFPEGRYLKGWVGMTE